ncbi:MAG TPA: adhesin [Firmicutes bacterium]|nr:adhesin [Bacillota bacterium]
MKKIIMVLVALLLVGCEQTNNQETNTQQLDSNQITVATTLYPISFLVQEIGGDYVEVESIISNGADAHSYEPTIQQMKLASDAQLFIYLDESIETFMSKMLSNIEAGNAQIIALAENLDLELEHTHDEEDHDHEDDHDHEEEEADHDHDHEDNHIWLNPMYMIEMAEVVLENLSAHLPEQASTFQQNFENLKGQLLELDEAFHELSDAPKPYFMVAHAAYGSWETYGIHQIPITGILGNDEPTQQELIELINLGKEHELNYIYYEQNIPSANAQVIQKELNLESLELHNLATITNEELKAGKNYFDIMYQNIENLKEEIYK